MDNWICSLPPVVGDIRHAGRVATVEVEWAIVDNKSLSRKIWVGPDVCTVSNIGIRKI